MSSSRKWVRVPTDQLLPNDVCAVPCASTGCALPADMVLVGGSCVVNEAMLTGEAVPQLKVDDFSNLRVAVDQCSSYLFDKVPLSVRGWVHVCVFVCGPEGWRRVRF